MQVRCAHLGALALLLAAAPLTVAGPLAASQAEAQLGQVDEQRDLEHFNLGKRNLAIEGYDPVAYFKEGGGKPRKGAKSIELVHRGVRYRFASEKNRELFKQQPARFEPLYGGWCAYAMSQHEKGDVDPESFLVTDGELKLFYKGWFADNRKQWLKDPKGLKPKADAYWKTLTEKK